MRRAGRLGRIGTIGLLGMGSTGFADCFATFPDDPEFVLDETSVESASRFVDVPLGEGRAYDVVVSGEGPLPAPADMVLMVEAHDLWTRWPHLFVTELRCEGVAEEAMWIEEVRYSDGSAIDLAHIDFPGQTLPLQRSCVATVWSTLAEPRDAGLIRAPHTELEFGVRFSAAHSPRDDVKYSVGIGTARTAYPHRAPPG